MVMRTRRAGRMAPEERRAAIVAATLPLVLRHGAAVSTRQIAEAADVAEGTIFRVFPDKDALMRAVTAKAFDPEPSMRELAAVDATLPLRQRLVEGVRIMQRRLSGVFGLIDALGLTHPPEQHRHEKPSAMNEALLSAIVTLVGDDGHRLRVEPAELAHVLRLLVFSGTHPRITDGHPLRAEQIVSIVLDGLLVRPDAQEDPDASPEKYFRHDATGTRAPAHHHTIEDRAC